LDRARIGCDRARVSTLSLPEDAAARARAREVVSALGRLRHPHLVPCAVTMVGDAAVQVAVGDLPGPRLPDLLEGGRLTAGQVVTLGVPIAQALEAGAAVGVVHGGLDPSTLVVEPGGRPLLLGLGLAQLAGASVTHAADVHELARLLAGLLDPDAGADGAMVSAALAPALSGHVAARPAAGSLAAALLAACAPQPLPVVRTPGIRTVRPVPRPPDPWWSRLLRWLGDQHASLPRHALTAGILGIVLVVGAGLVAARGGEPRPEPSPAPVPPASPSPAVNWSGIVSGLAAARHEAYVQADPALLAAADAPGSAALAIDTARVRAWREAGLALRGDPAAVQLLQVQQAGERVGVLRISEVVRPFDVVDGVSGERREHRPGKPPTTWTVTLVRGEQGWRTASVSP
jgi:hypothetical protein